MRRIRIQPARLIWPALAVAGIALAALGAARGEPQTVWAKAAHICLECIGIG